MYSFTYLASQTYFTVIRTLHHSAHQTPDRAFRAWINCFTCQLPPPQKNSVSGPAYLISHFPEL